MNKAIFRFNSFSTRLSLYIVLTAALVFSFTFAVIYYHSYHTLKEEAVLRTENVLEGTVSRMDNILQQVETALDNTEWLIRENLNQPERLYALTRKVLENNPGIAGCAIAFEPDYYPQYGHYFSPYSYRSNDSIRTIQLGQEAYDYHYMDWYQIPKLLDRSYWSEPYFDKGGGKMTMSTFSKPIYDADHRLIGIFTADISLEKLTAEVLGIRPFAGSYNILIGRGGTYIVHPNPERILCETVFTATVGMKDTTVRQIGKAMIEGRHGLATLQNDDTLSYVVYGPLPRTQWSLGIVCPHRDIFATLDELQTALIGVFAAGLLLILLICILVIKRVSTPLKRFSDAVVEIAHGRLDAPLPRIRTHDEMQTLYQSFKYMQQSLAQYIRELTETTSQKERIESELRIASNIQMGMVPKTFPPFPERKDVDLYAQLTPAKEVGGDLYDFFIQNEKLHFIIGDVSGKGVPASLFMAITRSLYRMIAMKQDNPAEIVRALNETMAENNEANMFVTLFTGIIDLKTGELSYCNAGHNPPVISDGNDTPHYMKPLPNIPVGLIPGFEYTGQKLTLRKGSTLFLYTDGATEAENQATELYGEERLIKAIQTHIGKDAQTFTLAIHREINAFVGKAPQSDDLTILTIRLTDGTAKKE